MEPVICSAANSTPQDFFFCVAPIITVTAIVLTLLYKIIEHEYEKLRK
tara:strand:+ start:43125 stop:43268 length:144 start_codon:yes stop_codon:yes gene_type:complete